MNDIMKYFGQQTAGDSFDQIKISIASPEQIRSWSYGEVKSLKPLTTVRLSRKETVCSALAFLGRSKTMNVCAANTKE